MFLHASRKTFSNVKVSISAQWTPSLQNQSLSPGQVVDRVATVWDPLILVVVVVVVHYVHSDCNRHGRAIICLQMKRRPLCSWEPWTPSSSFHMLWWVANIFLSLRRECPLQEWVDVAVADPKCDLNVFSQGLYLSGVIGDRVNLRLVLCFGLCGSATVVSIYRCSVYTVW